MPPKRRGPPRSAAAAQSAAPPAPKRSRLAKENDITAAQEDEIREAFSLFAVKIKDSSSEQEKEDEGADEVLGAGRRRRRGKAKAKSEEEEGLEVLKRGDVRRCLIALNIAPTSSDLPEILDTLDPTETGFIPFEPFLGYCALMLNRGSPSPDGSPTDPENPKKAEIDEAYGLFTHQQGGPITIGHLRRIAKELREEVPEDVLKDMILEANGGVGQDGLRLGVGREDFEAVMKRAGVFG